VFLVKTPPPTEVNREITAAVPAVASNVGQSNPKTGVLGATMIRANRACANVFAARSAASFQNSALNNGIPPFDIPQL